jgi:hypothetical protein
MRFPQDLRQTGQYPLSFKTLLYALGRQNSARVDIQVMHPFSGPPNADTGFFLRGCFLQQAVLQGQDVFREIRQQNAAKYCLYPGAN